MAKIIGNTTATPNPRPDWAQTDEIKADYIKNKPAIEVGEGANSIVENNGDSRALGEGSQASGFLTLAGVSGWTIVGYTKNENVIRVSDPNQTLTSLLDLSRTIYYNVRLSVSHYDMWGTVQNYERVSGDENIVLLTISDSIPENYIGEANPDRNTIIFYAPFLDEEIDDNLTTEELKTAVLNSLTYRLLTEGDVTIGSFTSASGFLSYAFKMMSHAEGYFTRAMGRYSHAEGRNTISGYSAHAEGYGAQALGLQSHAEGNYTLAKNYAAHAEGDQTEALGHGAHAEGMLYGGDSTKKTKAVANGTHAEGQGTLAYGMGSHTEGGLTQAGGEYNGVTYGGGFAHAEGFETKALMARSHAEGEGTKTLGQAAHAEGGNTTATGKYSHSEGSGTNAISDYSHAEGTGTEAEGEGAHSEGRNTVTNGAGAHAEGSNTKAIGHSAHTEGFGSATGTGTPSFNGTSNDGYFAHAEGVGTLAKGAGSHAEGGQTEAIGPYSHSEGYNTDAIGVYSHAEGKETKSDGEGAHSEGLNTTVNGEGAHAEGRRSIAFGSGAHAEGSSTCVNNGHSGHAEGYGTLVGESTDVYKTSDNGTTTKGFFAHAEGVGTQAEGAGAHAEGRLTVASGNYSHTGGLGTKAIVEAQTAIGQYNAEDSQAKLVVGVGTSNANRANAFTAGNDGTNDYITIGEEKLTERDLSKLNSIDLTNYVTKDELGDIEAALDAILAIQKELLPAPTITFTIDGTEYTANEGMTWGEWCESDYNTIGVYNTGVEIRIYTDREHCLISVSDGFSVDPNYTINPYEDYTFL